MVFFVCEGCNESLKKAHVDKHAAKCRNCYAVTCVDCQVTFHGNDYAAHTVCMSEAEKYEKSLFKGKKEKANPQDSWQMVIDHIASNADKVPINIRANLLKVCECTNVPRNKKKFCNFVKNSARIYSDTTIEAMWTYIEEIKTKHFGGKQEPTSNVTVQIDTTCEIVSCEAIPKIESSGKKRKHLTEETEETVKTVEEEDSEVKKEKKKKKKSHKGDDVAVEELPEKVIAEGDDSASSKKEKKKKKKHSQEE